MEAELNKFFSLICGCPFMTIIEMTGYIKRINKTIKFKHENKVVGVKIKWFIWKKNLLY